jgi:hypothetical protein
MVCTVKGRSSEGLGSIGVSTVMGCGIAVTVAKGMVGRREKPKIL